MKKPVKTKKETFEYDNNLEPKSLKNKIISIETDGTVTKEEYICDNNQNPIYLTVTTLGEVVLGEAQYKIDNVWYTLNENEKFILGTNDELDGKKIKILRTAVGDEGTDCKVSVRIEGGYRNVIWKLSSEIDNDNSVTFIIYVRFI